MKIILFVAIFGIIASYLPVVNVWYNYVYELSKDYSQTYTEYYFRALVYSSDKMDIELNMTLAQYHSNYFTITIMDYDHEPTGDEIYYRTNYIDKIISLGREDRFYEKYGYMVLAVTHYPKNRFLGIIVSYEDTWQAFSYLNFKVDITKYKYSDIKELDYNQHYDLYTLRFVNAIIPEKYQIFIRIKVISDDNMEIRLTTDVTYDRKNDFKVDVCQYKDRPVESQVYYGKGYVKCDNNLPNSSEEDKKYVYSFSTELEVKYLSISMINYITNDSKGRALKYLDIYIYSETGMAIAILVTIIVVPIIVVGAIIYFVLRKFGYCKSSS